MKKLYSCGCSFMSRDLAHTNVTSFLDLYCEERGFEHVNLARSGATNFLIRLQVEEALKQNADYIVFSATTNDRIDIPIPAREKDIRFPVTVRDVEFNGYRSTSELLFGDNDAKIISDSINNWTEDDRGHGNKARKMIPESSITAMKHYVANLHNPAIEQQRDYFILSDAIRRLQSLKKEFLFLRGPMFCNWDWVGNNLWNHYGTMPQPWDVPLGTVEYTVNHSPQAAHDMFVKSMLALTPTWKN